MLVSLAASAALLSASTALPSASYKDGADPGVRTRWLDLRGTLAAGRASFPGIDLNTHLVTAQIDSLEPSRRDLDLGPEAGLGAGDLTPILNAAIGLAPDHVPEVFALRRRVTGTEAQLAEAQARLDAVRAILAQTVDVEVFQFDGTLLDPDAGSILDAEAAATLVARMGGANISRRAVPIGRAFRFAEASIVSFLADYDVEIAQGALGPDPVVSIIHDGLEVALRVDRAADGRRWLVRVWGRDGDLQRSMRTVELGAIGGSPLELPRMDTAVFTSSALLDSGALLVIDPQGSEGSTLAVRVSTRPGAAVPASLVPMGDALASPMRCGPLELAFAQPSQGYRLRHDDDFGGTSGARVRGDDTRTLLAAALGREPLAGEVTQLGSDLFVPGADDAAAETRAALRALGTELSGRTVTVDLRHAVVDAARAASVRTPEGLQEFVESAPGRRLGSAYEQDALLLLGGREATYLQDHDVQVAAGAALMDPIVRVLFEGLSVWCQPEAEADGRVTAWFDVSSHLPAASMRQLSASNYAAREGDGSTNLPLTSGRFHRQLPIELPETHRVSGRTLVEAQAGDWALVLAQPFGSSSRTLVVAVRFGVTGS